MNKDRARPGDKAGDKALPVAASSRPFLYDLVATAMVCGAVWTSLITVMLVV